MITLSAICFGLTAIKYAMVERFEYAVFFILIAALLDVLDGKFARALRAVSEFGGHLDSLADFVNFGFVPVFILYLWELNEMPRIGWAALLFFTMCCAIRLARFNVDIEENSKKADWNIKFFKGVPSPAGALFCLAPIMISFVAEDKLISGMENFRWIKEPIFLSVYVIFFGFLMISRLPTYSIKKVLVKKEYTYLVFALFAFLVMLVFIQPWLVVLLILAFYLLLLPFSVAHYYRLLNSHEK